MNEFTVEDRGWTVGREPLRRGQDLTNHLWPAPNRPFGKNTDGYANSSSASPMDVLKGKGTAPVAAVASGPNKGYAYVTSEPSYHVARYWHINARLLAGGPEEIPDIVDGQAEEVRHWDYLKRRGKDPGPLLVGTIGHETRGANGGRGHQGQIEAALSLEACGDASAIADRIRKIAEGAADTAFWAAAAHHQVYGNHGTGSPVAYWEPGRQPYDTLYIDTRKPHEDPNAYSPGCDWHF